MSEPNTYSLEDLLHLMARLREPDYGCPWDLAQSYKTIVSSTLEEAYEVVDAIEQGDHQQLKEELGDLLFQIVFYSQLGHEEEQFNFHDIVSLITEKLLRRHPHVFPDGTLDSRMNINSSNHVENDINKQDESQGKIKQAWEKIKEGERQQKGHNSLMDDIPIALPSTVRAYKLQKRAASANFDWPSTDGVYSKVQEEIDELKSAMADLQVLTNDLNHAKLAHVAPTSDIASIKDNIEEELGDVFFTLINLSRHLKVEPETALRKANSKFEARFRHLEAWAQQQSLDISTQQPEVLEEWWQRAKKDLVE